MTEHFTIMTQHYNNTKYMKVYIIPLFSTVSPRWDTYAPMRFAGEVGASLSLFCRVRAFPKVSFAWRAEGSRQRQPSRDQSYYSEFAISYLTEQMYGDYRCHASNVAGNNSFLISLEQPGK